MCRLAAYLGKPLRLKHFLLEPPHSLYVQSWQPRELVYARLNADGYGFGWFDPEQHPAVYASTMPIWSDCNLPHLANTLTSPLWLAEIRSATAGNPVHQCNTPPFFDNSLIYVHNGFIGEFHMTVRPRIQDYLSAAISADINGNTDSEYLFALLRQVIAHNPELPLEIAIKRMFDLIGDWVGEMPALLNMIVSDGRQLYAARHALNHASPSLYYTVGDEAFPEAGVIASERFNGNENWQPVPDHHILVLDAGQQQELIAL